MRVIVACVCLFLGGACLALLPTLHQREELFFLHSEPYFSYPVPPHLGHAIIRRDTEGKGYYGASRNRGRKHEGIDLLALVRMPITAAKSGRVAFAGVDKGYGKYVELSHPDGRVTRYAHLSETCVLRGMWVSRGDVIGVSGKTGNAAGRRVQPHLHFEIRQDGKPQDPSRLMDPAIRTQ